MKRMLKQDPPLSSGVFKPVGHVVVVFADEGSLDQAESALGRIGFVQADLIRYAPDEMIELAEDNLLHAGALASMGSEINLTRKHLELAREGCWFLVVFAPDDEQVEKVRQTAESLRARFAQRYGRLVIEELIDTAESPRA